MKKTTKATQKNGKDTRKSEKEFRGTPIVTIMGHVDHGKTTLLDAIRGSNIQSTEHGGITQRVSVYTVDVNNDRTITFVDTPGHEAFDLMRSRSGSIADIVLLIVAANDGVKPQTLESIEIINKSNSKPLVVITKTDLPNIDIEAVKRELAANGMPVEGMGGDTPVIEVSAKTGKNIKELLDMILTLYELEGGADKDPLPDGVVASAYILETIKDRSRGFVSSIIVTQGNVSKGDWIVYVHDDKVEAERIKGFISEDEQPIESLQPGFGGLILGLSKALNLGEKVFFIKKKDKKLLSKLKNEILSVTTPKNADSAASDEASSQSDQPEQVSDEDLLAAMFADDNEDEKQVFNVILKAPSQGVLEALVKAVEPLEVEEVSTVIQSASVGNVTLKDVEQAELTKSLIIAFDVGSETGVEKIAKTKKVLIKPYTIIYKVVEEIIDVLTMLALPSETEEELGTAAILQTFTLSNGDKVLGGRVDSGVMKKGAKAYVVRGDEILGEGTIISLKHGKDEIKEAQKGSNFGLILSEDIPDVQEGDQIHCFRVIK